MANSTEFGNTALHDVLSRYSFYQGKVDTFSVLPQKLFNVNAKFTIGNSAWVIKSYQRRRPNESLKLSHWFQLELQDTDIPIARLVATIDNETFVSSSRQTYSIHQWIDGKTIDYSREPITSKAVESLAINLARLHEKGRDIYRLKPTPMRKLNKIHAPAISVAQIKSSTKRRIPKLLLLKLKPRKTVFDRWVLNNFSQLERAASGFLSYPAGSFADLCYTHNDIYWGNLIYDTSDELKAFIDFDQSGVSSWEYEAGSAAAICALDGKNIQTFIRAYEREANCVLNIELFTLAMQIKTVRVLLWCVHAHLNLSVGDQDSLEAMCFHFEKCWEGVEEFRRSTHF